VDVNITKPLKKFLPNLLGAREQNLGEADTKQRVIEFLKGVLCYDPIDEITLETPVGTLFVDMALKIDNVVRVFVELKAAGIELKDKHIEKAKLYAAEANLPWIVLTNGIEWVLFHLSFEDGIDAARAFSIDLSLPDELGHAAEKLALLHRHAVGKGSLDDFWHHQAALSPQSISKALFTDDVLKAIRHKLHKAEGVLIDVEDLGRSIHDMFSNETREEIGPFKIHHVKAKHTDKPAAPRRPDSEASPPSEQSKS